MMLQMSPSKWRTKYGHLNLLKTNQFLMLGISKATASQEKGVYEFLEGRDIFMLNHYFLS